MQRKRQVIWKRLVAVCILSALITGVVGAMYALNATVRAKQLLVQSLASQNIIVTAVTADDRKYGGDGQIIQPDESNLFPSWVFSDKYVFMNIGPQLLRENGRNVVVHRTIPGDFPATEFDGKLAGEIAGLGQVRNLSCFRVNFTHDSNRIWPTVSNLDSIYCVQCNGLEISRLTHCAKASRICLDFSSICDNDVILISRLTTCNWLSLRGCPVSDEVVPALCSMPRLEYLDVRDTAISDKGCLKLGECIFHCTILTNQQ